MTKLSTPKVHFTQSFRRIVYLCLLKLFFSQQKLWDLETTQGCYCHLCDFAPVLIINRKLTTTVLQTVVCQAESDSYKFHDSGGGRVISKYIILKIQLLQFIFLYTRSNLRIINI